MKITLEDLRTGIQVPVEVGDDYWTTFDWTESNLSCDCNRGRHFGHDDGEGHLCLGTKRYKVAAVEPMPADYTLADFNVGYPEGGHPTPRPVVSKSFCEHGDFMCVDCFKGLIEDAVEKEREACAKLADDDAENGLSAMIGERIAAKIRAKDQLGNSPTERLKG